MREKALATASQTLQHPFNKPLPEGWQWVELGEVAEYINGRAFKPDEWTESGLPIIRIQNLNSSNATFNYFEGKVDAHHRVNPGDLLISWSASLDAFIWKGDTAVLNQHIFKVIENSGVILRDYLYFAAREAMNEIRTQVHGATMQHITKPEFTRIRIPLPPLHEQKRIAAILNEHMAAVERARTAAEEQLKAAKALPVAYFKEAFHGITPLTTNPIEETAPAGWRWELLTKLAQLESGHTPSRYYPEWWGGDIPWIALPDIRNLDGKIAYETSEYTNKAGIANSSARILPKDTVVLSRTASVGFVTIMGRPMATSQDFVNWVCGPNLNPHFLALLLRASRDYILSLASGAVHKTVYVPTVKSFRVCLPPPEEQERIATILGRKLKEAEKVHNSLQDQLDSINKLPAALLRRAFNGEL